MRKILKSILAWKIVKRMQKKHKNKKKIKKKKNKHLQFISEYMLNIAAAAANQH